MSHFVGLLAYLGGLADGRMHDDWSIGCVVERVDECVAVRVSYYAA